MLQQIHIFSQVFSYHRTQTQTISALERGTRSYNYAKMLIPSHLMTTQSTGLCGHPLQQLNGRTITS